MLRYLLSVWPLLAFQACSKKICKYSFEKELGFQSRVSISVEALANKV